MKGSFSITKMAFSAWKKNKRIISVFILVLINVLKFVSPLQRIINILGFRTRPWLFPHFMTSPLHVTIFYMAAILLFADAPFLDDLALFKLGRSGKKAWYMGNLAYIFLASLIYVLSYLIFLYIFLFTKTSIGSGWGRLLETLAIAGDQLNYSGISPYVISQYSPIDASIISFILALLEINLLGLIIFSFDIFMENNKAGILIASLYSFAPSFLWAFGIEAEYKYFPAIWIDLRTFDSLGLSSKPKAQKMVLFLILTSLALAFFAWKIFKNREIKTYLEL